MIQNSDLSGEELNAESIWNEWFPEIKSHVFISHSGKDAGLAVKFAAWLKREHQLTAFIDSEIWGHSDSLLKQLDRDCCLNPEGKTYDYKKRNGSTAHVHMILSYALTRMIDKTECFIFLESHNSVTAEQSVKGTYSPWIFHELATVDTIKPQESLRPMPRQKIANRTVTESFSKKIKYPLLGKRIREIDNVDLRIWNRMAKTFPMIFPLDILYELCPLPKNTKN